MYRFFCTVSAWLILATGVFAQSGFIYPKEAGEFNFPQFDLCLSLPAGAGFEAPLPVGRNASVEIENQVYYYFDLAHAADVDSPGLKFALSAGDEADCLSIYLLPAGERRIKQEIDYLVGKYPAGAYRALPPVSAEPGTFRAFRLRLSADRIYDTYILSEDDYSYMFRLNGKLPAAKRAEYEAIITGIRKKTLAYRRTRYEAKVQSEPFAFAGGDAAKEIKLSDNQGILLEASFFSWQNPGLSVQIPAGFKYQMGEGMSNIDRFYNRDISVAVTDYADMASAGNSLRLRMEAVAYADTIEMVVDGMPVDAVYYGGKESGTLLFFVEGDEGTREVSFGGVARGTIPAVERIISSIRLNIPKEGMHTRKNERLSSLLKLESPGDVALDEPLLLGSLSAGAFTDWDLTRLGIRLQLPAGESSYNRETNKNSLRIWNPEPEKPSYVITKEEMKPSLAQSLQEKKKEWANYKNTEVIHASITRVNNIDWSLFFFKVGEQSYGGIMTAYKGDYVITITIPYQAKKEEALKKASLIKGVWFKVIPSYS